MKEPLEQKTREDLEREIIELKRQLAAAYELIRKQSKQIEELQRAGKRQAVPFARREEQQVKKPRKRGRKPGQGQFKNREKPKEEEINETKKAELSGSRTVGARWKTSANRSSTKLTFRKSNPSSHAM